MRDGIPEVLTDHEVADLLGVTQMHVRDWARAGLLSSCARSEAGNLLFYRWRVLEQGPTLAAVEPVRYATWIPPDRKRKVKQLLHDTRRLDCGCCLAGDPERPAWLCTDARELKTSARLCAALAAAAPDNEMLAGLAEVAAVALARHFAADETRTAPAAPATASAQPTCEAVP